jgi:hypothetical protein
LKDPCIRRQEFTLLTLDTLYSAVLPPYEAKESDADMVRGMSFPDPPKHAFATVPWIVVDDESKMTMLLASFVTVQKHGATCGRSDGELP